jgi:signal peptidase II
MAMVNSAVISSRNAVNIKVKPNATIWLLLSIVLIGLDQWTKAIALEKLVYNGPSIPFIDGFWQWTLAYNYGAAFSFLADHSGWQRWLFTTLAIGVSGFLIFLMGKTPRHDWKNALPFALVIAGALGNVIDRIRYGYVVDFVDWYIGDKHWPVFNLADSCIVVAVALLLIFGLFEKKVK